jgi:hypothetical protein
MAVGNHKVDAATGLVANPAQVHGGTFIDGGSTSASAAISNRLSLGLERDTGGTGQTENVNAEKALSGGTWDYQAAGEYMVRRMATTLNGSASSVLTSGGSNHPRRSIHVRSNQIGAHLGRATRAGLWRPTGISGQRSNWAAGSGTEDGAAFSVATVDGIAGIVSTANANYAGSNGSLSATADDAARPTRAVPGEFVILAQHASWSESVQGDGTVSENLMDYATRN